MNLTVKTLKGLIKEVIKENEMTLVEEIAYMDEQAVFDALAGKDFKGEKILTLGIMSGQNPDAIEMSPEENAIRAKALEDEIKSMKPEVDAIHVGGVFEGNTEDSLLIINPHKAAGESARGFGSYVQDGIAVMDYLNNKFGQWGYVYGKKDPKDPIEKMQFEMMQMDKYSDRFADDVEDLPGEEE